MLHRWRYGIEAIIGYPGSGKSLVAVDWALRAIRRGRPVQANIEIAGAHPLTFEQFRAGDLIPGALVILDEASRWFDARLWKSSVGEAFVPFLQGRKQGLALVWTAQRFGSVDVLVRDVTSRIWEASPVGFGYKRLVFDRAPLPVAFAYTAYRRHVRTDEWERVRRLMISPWRLRSLYRAYSTLEQVGRGM